MQVGLLTSFDLLTLVNYILKKYHLLRAFFTVNASNFLTLWYLLGMVHSEVGRK